MKYAVLTVLVIPGAKTVALTRYGCGHTVRVDFSSTISTLVPCIRKTPLRIRAEILTTEHSPVY